MVDQTVNSTIPFQVVPIQKPNLDSILNDQVLEMDVSEDVEREATTAEGYCVECSDQPAVVYCEQCLDDFCQVCFAHQHRKGSRLKHTVVKLKNAQVQIEKGSLKATILRAFQSNPSEPETEMTAEEFRNSDVQTTEFGNFVERSKYIPLRLTYDERKYLRLLDAALNVSEYTDKIDVIVYSNKAKRIVAQIKELCSILSGLVLAADYNTGQSLFKDRDFEHNSKFFRDIFELGRRHKIMNPEKMRSTYGKLVYMLQDSQISEVQEMLGFQCVQPIKTVYLILKEHGSLGVLEDDLIEVATQEIREFGRKRHEIQTDIKRKEKAIEILAKKYSKKELPADMIRQCLYSIGDNNSFLRTNRDPCERMIEYLKTYFDPTSYERDFSLAIQSGREGARLSHGHEKQYQYVLQSLSLWREVLHDMFKLWTMAEDDLLEQDNYYRLRDTGQGLNRVQGIE